MPSNAEFIVQKKEGPLQNRSEFKSPVLCHSPNVLGENAVASNNLYENNSPEAGILLVVRSSVVETQGT